MSHVERPSSLSVEQHGIETIPLHERTYRPRNIFTIVFGSSLTYTVVIFGAFPVAFGLGWWASVAAILTGLVVGAAVLWPMGLLAPKTGTNNAVSSGAYFGILGRSIGSFLALFSALGFVALTVWTSGDALAATLGRFVSTSGNDAVRAISYALVVGLVITIAVRGIHLMARVQELMIPVMSTVMLLGVLAFAPDFDASYAGASAYLLGSFTPTFIASAVVVAGLVVSLAPFVGDWARYIDPDRYSPRQVANTVSLACVVGIGLPILWGCFLAVTFADRAGDFIPTLVSESPAWFLPGLLLLASVAGVAQGSFGLYGTGLDTSSLIPRLRRSHATFVIGATATALVYLGAFVWDALAVVNAFVVLLLVFSAPWIVIVSIGHFVRRGSYDPDALQVFTRGQTGGRYWFDAGWNWRAVASWLLGCVAGLLVATAEPIVTGPWAASAGGVDISLPVAGGVTAVAYLVALILFPEPRFVFPEEGPRLVSARTGAAIVPIKLRTDQIAPTEMESM